MHAARIHFDASGDFSIETLNETGDTISLMLLKCPSKANEFIHLEVYVNEPGSNARTFLGPLQLDVQCNDELLKLRHNPTEVEVESNRDVLERELLLVKPNSSV
jgi:hypothetical protein